MVEQLSFPGFEEEPKRQLGEVCLIISGFTAKRELVVIVLCGVGPMVGRAGALLKIGLLSTQELVVFSNCAISPYTIPVTLLSEVGSLCLKYKRKG